jgi:hypothetical protein
MAIDIARCACEILPCEGKMGRELNCTVRSGGTTCSGKVLLESEELIFRGEPRLKIRLAEIKSASARNGERHLRWSGGSAIFELGDQATKWAERILHPKSTTDKLGIKPGMIISAISIADDKFLADARGAATKFSTGRALKDSNLIFFGAENTSRLAKVTALIPSLNAAGALWIVYAKGRQEIKEGDVLTAGRTAGLVDVKVVKFSDSHTGLKFVRPRK